MCQVHHIHARIGTTQASQCPEPLNTAFAAEREFFEGFWIDIIKAKQREDPRCRITWVPEYGYDETVFLEALMLTHLDHFPIIR